MSDVAKYLPLSGRPSVDETQVTGDWSTHLDAALGAVTALLGAAAPSGLDLPARRAGYSVRDCVGDILWQLASRPRERTMQVLREALRSRRRPAAVALSFARQAAALPRDELLARLRAAGGAPGSHQAVGHLSAAVVNGYDIAATLGVALQVDPIASGAVAVARAANAPLPVRAVLRGRTLSADGTEWAVGRGPKITGSAGEIILFLWGRGGVPAH